MDELFTLANAAVPVTPDSEGHDLTWPYWVIAGTALVLVVILPFIMGRRAERRTRPGK